MPHIHVARPNAHMELLAIFTHKIRQRQWSQSWSEKRDEGTHLSNNSRRWMCHGSAPRTCVMNGEEVLFMHVT